MNDKRNVQVVPKIRRYTRFVPWLLVLFFGFQLANCSFIWPYKWRQKIIVTVDTPNGEKVGSAVSEIRLFENRIFKDGARWRFEYSGEAVVIDFGAGKYLFVLLGGRDNSSIIGDMGFKAAGLYYEDVRQLRRKRDVMLVPPEKYPLFVTFDDVNDPKSVREVKPDDLAGVFGAGYRLKGINVQITDDDVTVGNVEKVLGWVTNHQGRIKEIPVPTPNNYVPSSVEEIYRSALLRDKPL